MPFSANLALVKMNVVEYHAAAILVCSRQVGENNAIETSNGVTITHLLRAASTTYVRPFGLLTVFTNSDSFRFMKLSSM